MWNRIVRWIEDGDLTPLAMIISVAHYGPVLVSHGEHVVVAWVVGAMMDLLHFRSVRYVFQKSGWVSGLVAAATTIMATGYHLRFYGNDWLLALPIPIGIGILAWHAAEKRRAQEAAGEEDRRLAEAASRVAALESQLQASESAMQASEMRVQAAESAVKASDKAVKALEKALAQERQKLQAVNPLAQDVIALMTGAELTQREIATRHGVSETQVSRLKASLNGHGGQ